MKPTLPATISQMNYTQLEEHRQRYVRMNTLWGEMELNSDRYRKQRDETMAANIFIIDKIERHQAQRAEVFCENFKTEILWMCIHDTEIKIEVADFY